MSLAVMPFTSFESSIQLRPCSGSSSICRRSTLPATCDDEVSTSGDSPVTVTVSFNCASFIMNGHGRVLPDQQLDIFHDDGREPGELGLHLVDAGRYVEERVLAAFVGDGDNLPATALIGRGDADARHDGLGLVDGRPDD